MNRPSDLRYSRSVLLVEDDDDFRLGLAEFLRGEGYLVTTAANGLEALSYLKEAPKPPSVVLLDLKMPVMSGWDFRAKMLEDPAFASIPVIVLTGAVTSADLTTLRASATLNKPVDFGSLLSMLEGTLLDACAVCGRRVGKGRKTVAIRGALAAVLCQSCEGYDDDLSRELTELSQKLQRTYARDRGAS
jgi:two-component system, chemotaxis family, chemotaxis protein CheY